MHDLLEQEQIERTIQMLLINLLVVLIVIGVALWLINLYIPMAPPIKTILNVVVVLLVLIWMLKILGFATFRVGP